MHNARYSARRLAVMSMMLAMITVLTTLEHSLPPIPFLPPNVRLGLSNIVTMYALFFMGWRSALSLAVMKSLFVSLTRGATAGFLSLLGGVISVLAIILLAFLSRNRCSYILLSVTGAICHNFGQMLGAALLLKTRYALYGLPLLVVSGVLAGTVTGALLRVVMPLFDRIVDNHEK